MSGSSAADGRILPPNVVELPRRLRDYPNWDAFLASYAPGPAEPGKVLAFPRRAGTADGRTPGRPARSVRHVTNQ